MRSPHTSYVSRITIALIGAYQRTISPDHGDVRLPWLVGHCRFYPSCSVYACRAIMHKGFFKGMLKSAWRVLRCNPFSRGGYDPI